MILMRRPFLIFDVDLIGALGVLVLGTVVAWLLLEPKISNAQGLREMHGKLGGSEPQRRGLIQELQATNDEIASLRQAVETHAGRAPKAQSVPDFISQIMAAAGEHQLQIVTVTPGQIQTGKDRLHCDVVVEGRGSSVNFIAFLSTLAERNPYQTVRSFSITRSLSADPTPCKLNWTLRFYMLPAPPGRSAASGENRA